jgi:hypothetical protein
MEERLGSGASASIASMPATTLPNLEERVARLEEITARLRAGANEPRPES